MKQKYLLALFSNTYYILFKTIQHLLLFMENKLIFTN